MSIGEAKRIEEQGLSGRLLSMIYFNPLKQNIEFLLINVQLRKVLLNELI